MQLWLIVGCGFVTFTIPCINSIVEFRILGEAHRTFEGKESGPEVSRLKAKEIEMMFKMFKEEE